MVDVLTDMHRIRARIFQRNERTYEHGRRQCHGLKSWVTTARHGIRAISPLRNLRRRRKLIRLFPNFCHYKAV
jgi:hypothetical protein